MSRLPVSMLLASLLCTLSGPTVAAPQIPSALAEWEGWVLHGEDVRRCPLQSAPLTVKTAGRMCAWPGELELQVDAHEARFRQRWRTYAESWVPLPGRDALWPEDVRVDERPAVVLAAQGAPRIRVPPGEFVVTGTLRYGDRPASLPVPAMVGIVRLVLDGKRIERPERTGSGSEAALWLGERAAPAEESHIDLRVHRLLEDAIPARLETRLALAVSGPAREVVLGPVLPEAYTPLALNSDLPARIDPDGRLRIQIRRGQWQVILVARAPGVVEQFRVPAAAAPWPAAETLSFAPQDSLRVVTLDGVAPVDAAQADVPPEWRGFSAYGVTPEDTLRLTERSRGLDGDAATHISLLRELWLDFDHGGWLARDHLRGQLSGRWRLDMVAPYRLESASAGGAALLVTSSDPTHTGIELRDRNVDVDALASIAGTGEALPATGWDRTMDHASTTLHLPPGHRLIAAFGVDNSSGDWLSDWTLLDIFVALLVTVATFRLLGAAAAAVALAALVLSFHEPGAPTWLWVNLILAVALVRVLPAGRLRRWARVWRAISFVLTLIVLVPFAFMQLRLALYPQLMAPVSYSPVPVPASPVPEEMPSLPAADTVAPSAAMTANEAIEVTAARKEVQRYTLAPGTVAQTGPGRPDWHYEDYALEYSGPVAPTQSMRLLIAPVWVISTLRVLGVAFSVLLLLLLGSSVGAGAERPPRSRGRGSMVATAAAGAVLVGALLLNPAARADTPPPEVLDELKHRLLEPPPCAPDCVDLAQAVVAVSDARISIDLEAHAGAATALALPLLNGKSSSMAVTGAVASGDNWVVSDARARFWALIEPGVRRLTLTLPPPIDQELRLQFPEVPRRIVVSAPGWSVTGLDAGRLVGDTIVLTRSAGSTGQAERQTTDSVLAVPPFAVIDRDIRLGLDLTMDTTVRRQAPAEGGFTLAVPMLAGESVTKSGRAVSIDGRTVRISFEAGRMTDTWTSKLAPAASMTLTAGTDVPWSEVWRIRASPVWHVTFAGTPEIVDAAGDARVFHPRPGESLKIELRRPQPVEGGALALDRVRVEHRIGARTTETTLGYGYRSTQGGRQILRLPTDAVLESLEVDAQAVPVRPEGGDLALPIQPGEHQVAVRLARPVAVGLLTRTADVELGAPGGNVTTHLELPASRWILWVHGSGVGPAILYWSELFAFLIVAIVVGRHPRSPLRVHEWLLLGLGLSTFSWWVLLVFAGWLFALEWRRQWRADVWWQFDAVQIALAVLGVVALVALVSAIPNGLLGSPDMRIAGPGSSGGALEWFDDRIAGTLPVKTVFSVSIWWYKAAMLLWALWLSFALVRWIPRAWAAFSTGGYWRRRTLPVTTRS